MQGWQFCVVGIAGVLTLFLFGWLLLWRKKRI